MGANDSRLLRFLAGRNHQSWGFGGGRQLLPWSCADEATEIQEDGE